MNLLNITRAIAKTYQKPKQVLTQSWEERGVILENDVNLFCWQRGHYHDISDYLENLIAQTNLPAISLEVTQRTLQEAIREAKAAWRSDDHSQSDAFWSDVHKLTHDFLAFAKSGKGKMILKVVKDNACTKFHTDGYMLRLFTTYVGRGTLWLPEEAINRKWLGTTNDKIVKATEMIQQLGTFDVGILKGEPHGGGNAMRGIVHRSPEIEKHHEKRLILRVDIGL